MEALLYYIAWIESNDNMVYRSEVIPSGAIGAQIYIFNP